jgi:hypothetical protein
VRDALKSVLPVSDYSFLGMCEGRCDGNTVTLWTNNDFVRDMMDKPAVTNLIAKTLQGMMGASVHVTAKLGTAPADRVAPAAPPPFDLDDALEAFLADSQGNIIVE